MARICHAVMPTGGNQEEGEVLDLLPQVLPQFTDSAVTSTTVPKNKLCPFLATTQNLSEIYFGHLLHQHLILEISMDYEVLLRYFPSPWTPYIEKKVLFNVECFK